MTTRIDSATSRQAAHAQLKRLLAHPQRQGLLGFANGLEADEAWAWAAGELRGVTLIDGGAALRDADMVFDGITQLQRTFPEPSSWTAYNIANGHNALWEIPLRTDGFAVALLSAREHLHASRRMFERIGADETADPALRVQGLVNAANSYDNLGRDQEALVLWGLALELDPEFAMARGNRGIALLHAAPFAGAHAPMLAAQAAQELDRALGDPDGVLRFGGERALADFRAARARLPAQMRRRSGSRSRGATRTWRGAASTSSSFTPRMRACGRTSHSSTRSSS